MQVCTLFAVTHTLQSTRPRQLHTYISTKQHSVVQGAAAAGSHLLASEVCSALASDSKHDDAEARTGVLPVRCGLRQLCTYVFIGVPLGEARVPALLIHFACIFVPDVHCKAWRKAVCSRRHAVLIWRTETEETDQQRDAGTEAGASARRSTPM